MVQQASRPKTQQDQVATACRHHWVIEAPTGPISRGICQLCEEVREFKNYIESAPWGEDTPVAQSGSRYPVTAASGDVEEYEEL